MCTRVNTKRRYKIDREEKYAETLAKLHNCEKTSVGVTGGEGTTYKKNVIDKGWRCRDKLSQ